MAYCLAFNHKTEYNKMVPVLAPSYSSNNSEQLINNLQNEKDTISISEYIFLRVYQLGVKSVFGVPGDFNLSFLEHIYDVPGLNWIGCCNELNASYAADAYAKVSHKMAVLLSTYGVGELSALNGIAGSYTEFAPVLHLVGTSAIKDKRDPKALNLHHLVSNKNLWEKSDHYVYERIAENFSVDCASIEDDPVVACEMIDRVIINVWKQSRPGYIFLPCDLSEMQVSVKRLNIPLALCYDECKNLEKLNQIVEDILEKIYNSKNVSLLADIFVPKFRLEEDFSLLIDKFAGKVNLFTTTFGKGIINEDNPRFVGTYVGKYEHAVKELIEESDLVLHVGRFDTEINNGFFSFDLKSEQTIELHPQYIRIFDNVYFDITMMDVLPLLVEKLKTSRVNEATKYEKPGKLYDQVRSVRAAPLTEVDLLETLNESLKPNDILIVETCSFLFAIPDIKFRGSKFICQGYWASIGYALPATLGASLALRDFMLPGQVVTVEGDGSAQMSLQELSSMLRYNINATMIILNNDGYTIERVIVGAHSSYNDINADWQWTKLLSAFGDKDEKKSESIQITEAKVLNSLLTSESFINSNKFRLVELILPKFDVPEKLLQLTGFGKDKTV